MMLLAIEEPETNNQKEFAVGIDLGTTNSLVAYCENGKAKIIPSPEGKLIVPSVVSYIERTPIVGKEASLEANIKIISSIKRFMGKGLADIDGEHILASLISKEEPNIIKFNINGMQLTAIEIAAEILKVLKNNAETFLAHEVTQAVITVPAYFDDAARSATKAAARLAGLEVLRLINEPTAAALAYGLDQNKEGVYLIYDLGGGTFDVSLLKMEKGLFQVLATGGDINLGGDDFDYEIYKYLLKQHEIYPDENFAQTLLNKAKFLKEQLTTREEAAISFAYNNTNIEFSLSRISFEGMITKYVARTMSIIQQVIEDANIKKEEINGIVLVGGATRTPLIREQLENIFAIPVLADVDPDQVVALGAAIQAESLTRSSNALLIDVTPLSLGLEIMGGISEKIIHRNTPIPVSVSQEFTTYQDGQTSMKFHIVQGEREMAEDCRSLAVFELSDIPPMKAGLARIKVNFTVDTDGLLTVTAQEEITGKEQHIIIKPSYGLDESAIETMLLESINNAKQDVSLRLLTETKIEAQQVIDAIIKAIKETPELIDLNEKVMIEQQLANLQQALLGTNRESIIQNVETIEKLAANFIARRLDKFLENSVKGKQVDEVEKNLS